jgi:uncharacterized membrane protein YraQ (UPF0718 family)
MASVAAPARPASTWRTLAPVTAALIGTAVLLRLLEAGGVAQVQNFVIVFSSLLIEAMPFILLGAVVSAAIEVFVPARAFDRLAALPRPLQLPACGLAGFAFPVCECGSVPVARRLASKGLSVGGAVTFMLAAPILNPIVLISTWVAYRGRDILWPMVIGRATLGLIVAVTVGWVVSRHDSVDFLRPTPEDAGPDPEHETGPRSRAFFGHIAGDFIFMSRFLVVGAAAAATLQTFVPQSIIGSVANTPVVALLAMMALAFVLSLCSESDAFVAASFVQFGLGAQLAFLVFGPMLDTKLGFLYSGAFSTRFLRTVVIVVTAVTLAGTLWIEVLFG